MCLDDVSWCIDIRPKSTKKTRRGYGCLVSYNVPPYARAGLYKDCPELLGIMGKLKYPMEHGPFI